MKNAPVPQYSRLRATVWGDLLEDFILDGTELDVRRKDGTLALKVNCLQAAHVARYGMAAGYVSGGVLRYLILRVPKSTVIRVLHMDMPRCGEITRSAPNGLRWPPRFDRAKLGRVGGFHRLTIGGGR